MGCDMCGESKKLYITMVEGTEMQLCDSCKMYGQVKRAIPTVKEAAQQQKKEREWEAQREEEKNTIELIVSDFGRRIKNARENRRLTQEQLAKQLALKESQLHKFESAHLEPDNETARCIERALGITLLEKYTEQKPQKGASTTSGPLTIADILKQAQKK